MESEIDSIEAEQLGMDAQREGKPRRPPRSLSASLQEWWLEGWDFSAEQETPEE